MNLTMNIEIVIDGVPRKMTMDEARELYYALKQVFGGNDNYFPFIQPVIVPGTPTAPSPFQPFIGTWCGDRSYGAGGTGVAHGQSFTTSAS